MNMIAIDIGNTNIRVGIFLKGAEETVVSIPGKDTKKLAAAIESAWQKIPVLERSTEKKRDGVIAVCSVKPEWTDLVKKIAKESLDEKIMLVGKEIPYPINISVKEPEKVGSDRILLAAAAYSVVEAAVAVADFGTAVTIDLVDDRGVFVGGTICPGFELSAQALNENTALLPKVNVKKPKLPFGQTTTEAINCGLYYSAVGALIEIIRRYAEKLGSWPRTVITGSNAKVIKDDCEFIDSYVPNLVIKGIALAYQKYVDSKQ